MGRPIATAGAIAVALIAGAFAFLVYVLLASSDPGYWEGDVTRFAERDISNPPPANAVLFAGGRTIRQWESLESDMAPLPVIRRGFGGAQIAHLAYYAPRLIAPYDAAAVVIIAGGADLADVRGRSPEDVVRDMAILVATLRRLEVEAPVYVVSLRPSPLRKDRWPVAERANTLLAQWASERADVRFLDVTSAFIADDGSIREGLFRWDGLSLDEEGYAALAALLKPTLMDAHRRTQNRISRQTEGEEAGGAERF